MEPVKGGNLVNLPLEAKKIVDEIGETPASLAIRFAASFDGMMMVLSGMSNFEQMKDNLSTMKDFKPLAKKEFEAINRIRNVFNSMHSLQVLHRRMSKENINSRFVCNI